MPWLIFAAVLYLISPGHPDVILAGVPIGQTGTILIVLLIVSGIWTRDVAVAKPRANHLRVIGVLIAVKLALSIVAPPSGWLGSYYANDQFNGEPRRSTEFRDLGATRIDRQLSFVDTELPVHFLNEADFNFGFRREVTEPIAVHWRGYVSLPREIHADAEASGDVKVEIDGQPSSLPATIGAGRHVIDVRYRKPRDTDPLLRVRPLDDGQPRQWRIGEVMPFDATDMQRTLARWLVPVAWLLHLVALAITGAVLVPAVVAKIRAVSAVARTSWMLAASQLVFPAVIVGLMLQGAWKARHLVDRVWTLTGGDDWLAYEMNARDGLLNGWLMPAGAAAGKGLPFYEYPGYGYFLALVHGITGESIAGPVLVNFLVLAVATILIYLLACRLTNAFAALIALAWLLAIEQLDFVRYYTVTLLSENLYFLLIALCLVLLVKFYQERGWFALIMCGATGGLAALTRPGMMLFLPVAMLFVAITGYMNRARPVLLAGPIVLMLCWMAVIVPVTIRNYIVSGEPVLITAGQAVTFVNYNVPEGVDGAPYKRDFTNSLGSAARILLMLLWDHPAEMLRNWGIKAGFSLGMVHWMGSGTAHPELLLTSVAYFAAIVLIRAARAWPAWPIHGFILTHLSTMLLTMPSNYGYRMVLPMYLFMVILAGALVAAVLEPRLMRRPAPSVTA